MECEAKGKRKREEWDEERLKRKKDKGRGNDRHGVEWGRRAKDEGNMKGKFKMKRMNKH